jgi:DNA-binding ferritin-like protein
MEDKELSKSVSEKAMEEPNKEVSISLEELKKEIYEEIKKKLFPEIVNELRKDFATIAYRVFALELGTYGLIKRVVSKEKIPEEYSKSISQQEDLILSGVETMLNRLNEIEKKALEDEMTKNEEAMKSIVKNNDKDKEDKK